ncbi:hypothetical protein H2248_010004 [Termitomyces sp. 'cryptogamus']|nr:hypothetical protein H2248_010004 [Termitomyces sp. 'cryptogamus']
MSLFSVFDHYTDVATPHEVQQMADMVMDAIRNPDKARPANECVVGEVARQFWKLSMRYASEGASRRFIESIDEYTASVVQEAEDRAQSYIRSIDEYFHVRRKTVGVKPSLALFQFGLNLPDDVLEDPIIERLTNACIDMIILDNDLYSYNVEQARGDAGHNIITIVMHQKKIGLSEAVNWIGDHHSKLGQQFLNDLKHVPHFDKMIELDVKHYLDGLGNWVRANECWSFESHRYFGMSGREVQQSRKVVLLPRSAQICSTKI